ncbi:c-type cytochrome [Paenibacillus eucommiae]|uniref:Cytochrome c551 n=1 Tax=Paenibacillus eucommiae TaxID=1355755 RepID=A0ABS4IQE8_9BACL|nr:cytochrome c [Paenibacillus eucommiae]MBP1989792.1 cytochrome c551 [Paenibacillus eucommiae]
MKEKGFLLIMMLISLALTACSRETDDSAIHSNYTAPEDASVMTLYKKQCLSCHAVDLRGRVGPNLQKVGARLNEQQLVEFVQNGARGMPAFKKILTSGEIESLAQWLATNK